MAKAWEDVAKKLFSCPVEHCTRTYSKEDDLGYHLWNAHNKGDLLRTLLRLICEKG